MKQALQIIHDGRRLASQVRRFAKQPRTDLHWSLWFLAGFAIAWFPFSHPTTVVYVILAAIVVWRFRVTVIGLCVIGMTYIITIIFVYYLSLIAPGLENSRQQIAFNSQEWRSGSRDNGIEWPTRLRMVDDLVKGGVLTGRSHKEVLAILGSPDNSERIEPNGQLEYMLGPERGPFRIDSESLYISFDDDGHVASVEVHR